MRFFKSIIATFIVIFIIVSSVAALFPAKETKELGMADLDKYVIKKTVVAKPETLTTSLVARKSISYGEIILEEVEDEKESEAPQSLNDESKVSLSYTGRQAVLAVEEILEEKSTTTEQEPTPEPTSEPEPISESEPEPTPEPEPEPVVTSSYYTVEGDVNMSLDELIEELANNSSLTVDDIIKLIKTYHGECDCVVSMAERSMVIWVILNRLDAGGFGSTVAEICTRPYQFTGYSANNPITERGFTLVRDVVMRWEREKAGETNVGRTIPKDILYFHADSIPSQGIWHNAFYKYSGGNSGYKIYFDRNNPIENPYES